MALATRLRLPAIYPYGFFGAKADFYHLREYDRNRAGLLLHGHQGWQAAIHDDLWR